MKKFLYASLLSSAFLGLAACGSDGDDPVDTAATTDGETTVGVTTGGETTDGETTAGLTTDGETTAGATTAGVTTDGETTAGGTTAGGTTAGGTTAGGTTAGGTTAGGTTGGGTVTGNVLRFGFVQVDDFEGELEAFAVFGEFTNNLTASQFNGELIPPLDTCEVSTFNIGDLPDLDDDTIFESAFNSLSAGETITLTSPAGTFATLLRFTFGDLVGYQLDETGAALISPAPSGLVADIPGDEFPAFSDVSIPDVTPLVVSSPVQGDTVTLATQFTWVPGGNPGAFLDISASTFTAQGESVSIDCVVEDDGAFTFPANVQSQVSSDFSTQLFDLARINFNLIQSGSTVLVTSNSSEN